MRVQSLGQEDSLEKDMATHSLENPHGWRSLVGYTPQGRKESDTTEVTEHTRTPYLTCVLVFIPCISFLEMLQKITKTWVV